MKILYIAHERRAAEAAATELRGLSQNFTLAWAQTPGAAVGWIRDNRDTQAVVMIAPEHFEGLLAAMKTSVAERQAQHDAAAARTARICTALQDRLLELEAALHTADQRGAVHTTAAEQWTRREEELRAAAAAAQELCAILENQLTRETAARTALEQRLAAADISRRDSDEKHAAEVAALIARLGERDAQHTESLTRSNRICRTLQERMQELEASLRGADERHAADRAAADRLALRETELGAALAEAIAARSASDQRLFEAETAHERAAADLASAVDQCAALGDRLSAAETARQTADDHHAQELGSFTKRLADLQAQYDSALEHTASVEQQLTNTSAALEQARQDWTSEITAAADQLAQREMEAAERYAALEDRLSAAETSRQTADDHHAQELGSWTMRLADLQAQYDNALDHTASIEQQLTNTSAALEQARQDWTSEIAAAAEQLAERETEFGSALAVAVAARTSVEQRLADAESAHQDAQQHAAADLTAAAERFAALEDRFNQEVEARATLEEQLAAAQSARQTADDHHAQELRSLTTRLADLQAQYDNALEHTASVEQQLTDTSAALNQARQDWTSEITAAAERYAALQDRLSAAETSRQAADDHHAQELGSLTMRLGDLQAQHESALDHTASVEQQLTETSAALEQARQDWTSEIAAAAERLALRETEFGSALADAVAARTTVERKLADNEAAHQDAQQRAAADLTAAAERYAALEDRLSAAVTARQEENDGHRRQLNVLRTQAAGLRREAERVPGLQLQLARSQKEIRRQFEHAPYGLCECTPGGAVTRVNHRLARLLGYRTSADLPTADFVATVFESAADLDWLLERVDPTGKAESVETALKTQDGRRLPVRLHALGTDAFVLIAVEDLTRQSALEQRAREAQRLEAVGRVASEVAATCDSLLRDVTHGGRLWLAGFEGDASLRHQGELLLGDVTRAAGLLRQLAVYGHKQITNLEPVSVARVLRDLKPVLERVLGHDIMLSLPKTTQPFDVDVESERVERILVNVANYARERMPGGGRVSIQLATAVVDRQFLARHPKVRPGAHVLITISEMQGAIRPALPMPWPIADGERGGTSLSAADKPGMDLGPLGALISDLGGHLWMSVEPAGNVTLQIHLPVRTQDEAIEPPTRSLPTRARRFARWLRH